MGGKQFLGPGVGAGTFAVGYSFATTFTARSLRHKYVTLQVLVSGVVLAWDGALEVDQLPADGLPLLGAGQYRQVPLKIFGSAP